MRIHGDNGRLRITVLYLLAFAGDTGGTSVTVSSSQSQSTCPARSINYITQTLPQQCLTSSWASKPIAQTSSTDRLTSKIEASTSVLNVGASPSASTDSSVKLTTYVESSNAESSASSSINVPDSAQTARSSEPPERAGQSDEPSQESDLDSPLDKSKFLSFEEWKNQNLAQVGQSAESLAKRQEGDGLEHRRRPASINNALETFGDDSEIDLDFSGFVNSGGMNEALPIQSSLPVGSTGREMETPKEKEEDLSNTYKRNKDAGKTCKERSNYASFDCAATVLKTNPECKSATSVLVESKDSYMLNVCSAENKFFIVELCDDILVDTIVLANFEFFSSMFRTFRVSVSDRYPVKMDRWKELGVFEARNSRAIQAFLVENPLIWARYLRIELLTHFGAEYYCPISLLRVHGTTMMEEFNHEVKGLRPEDEVDDETEDVKNEATAQIPYVAHTEVVSPVTEAAESTLPIAISTATSAGVAADPMQSSVTFANSENFSLAAEDFTPYRSSIAKRLENVLFSKDIQGGRCSPVHQSTKSKSTSSISSTTPQDVEESTSIRGSTTQAEDSKAPKKTQSLDNDDSMEPLDVPPRQAKSSQPPTSQNGTVLPSYTSNLARTDNYTTSTHANSTSGVISSVTLSGRDVSTLTNTTSATQSSKPNFTSTAKSSIQEPSSSSPPSASSVSPPSGTTSTLSIKSPSSSTQPPAANPSTQESFFKSVHKRLQQLEANSTLSLQYIEEQSRILRDAFSSVEKRQLLKTSSFLETLNTTVLTELRDFRMQYDQIWQSTVLELSSQREQSAQQVSVLSARMTFLADEIVFQKRIAMVQFMLILLCLGLIVFSRSGRASTYLELPPLVQNAIKRSSANLARYTHFDTPPASPSSSRPPSEGLSTKYGLFHRKSHRRTPSDESDANGGIRSPIISYSPPSPVSQISRDDREASPSGPSADELDNLSFN